MWRPHNMVLKGGMEMQSWAHQWFRGVQGWITWQSADFFPSVGRLSHSLLIFKFGFLCSWLSERSRHKLTYDPKLYGALNEAFKKSEPVLPLNSLSPFVALPGHGMANASGCRKEDHFKCIWLRHHTVLHTPPSDLGGAERKAAS